MNERDNTGPLGAGKAPFSYGINVKDNPFKWIEILQYIVITWITDQWYQAEKIKQIKIVFYSKL